MQLGTLLDFDINCFNIFKKIKGKMDEKRLLDNFNKNNNHWRQYLNKVINFNNENNFPGHYNKSGKKIVRHIILPKGYLSGSITSISFSIKLDNLNQLNTLVKEYYFYFSGQEYKNNFPWIDNISQVKNKGILEDMILQKIKESNISDFSMTAKDFIDLDEIDKIVISGFGASYTYSKFFDITFSDIFEKILKLKLKTLKIDDIKEIKIKLISTNIGYKIWSLYDCIYTEIKKGNSKIILFEGKWYKLNLNLIEWINSSFQNLLDNSSLKQFKFSPYIEKEIKKKIADNEGLYGEDVYNRQVYQENSDELYLLDRKNVIFSINNRVVKVEVSDLFSKGMQFIHVKKNSGEAVLCHLFFQGWKSAKYLTNMNDEYLNKLEEILIKELENNNKLNNK